MGYFKLGLMFDCGSLYLLPAVARESLSDDDWASHKSECSRISFGIISLILLPVVFDSILVLWASQSLVLGHPSSIRCRLHLIACVSS